MGGDASRNGAELFETEADFSAKIVTFRLVGGMHPPHPPPKSATGATLKQVEKFKYLGVAFTSDGRQEEELDTRIGKASPVMRALHYSVVMKRELSKKEKLTIFKAVFVPILTYGHESWVMTKRVRS